MLSTTPRKNMSERIAACLRRSRCSTCCTCDPTYPTSPAPAGRVHGHVLVESTPAMRATSSATSGKADADADRSINSNGFIGFLKWTRERRTGMPVRLFKLLLDHIAAAAAARSFSPLARRRGALRDFDLAPAVRVGAAEFLTFLECHLFHLPSFCLPHGRGRRGSDIRSSDHSPNSCS